MGERIAALRRGAPAMLNAVVSVHDVCPEHLGAIQGILSMLDEHRVPPATLLIIPGRNWDAAGLATLQALHEHGHPLAGHGWLHRADRIRGLRARLYSMALSRNVAEHLALDPPACAELVARSHAWFEHSGLPPPEIYVPPAWAKGPLATRHMQTLPYRYYEDLWGVYDAMSGKFHRLPVAGFEADSCFRRCFLGYWNPLQRRAAERLRRPLRIAIHPNDLALGLKNHLARLLSAVDEFLDYPGALARQAPARPADRL